MISNPRRFATFIKVEIFEAIYASQQTLRELAPEFKWTGLGNLLGDYGEFIAIEKYNLTKAPSGSGDYDAVTKDGKTVQVKRIYFSY